MRKILLCAATAATLAAYAQPTNYALSNPDGTGKAEAFTITELDGGSEATFQMWIKPSAWTQATLIGQDNFSIEMGATEGEILVKAGDQTATVTAANLVGNWSQLTVTINNGTVKAYVNNTEATVTGELPATFDATQMAFDQQGCVIAEGLHGSIDEVRVWSRALDQADFVWNNTINKWNDNYDALAAYWKFDQSQLTGNILDYRNASESLHHNGSFTGLTRDEVTDNGLFKYRIVSGYVPSIMRFTDRANINRDMFLLTNDVITLSAKVQEDGSLFPEYPDNSATPTNVDYVDEYEGRSGVMSFHGTGSQMVAEETHTPFDPTSSSGNGASQTGSVEGWIYIDEWVEGAEIYSNYVSDSECLVVSLGSEANKELVVNLCGTVGTLSGVLEAGKWQYIGAYLKPAEGTIDGRMFNPIYIGVGEYDESGEFVSEVYHKRSKTAVVLSGNDMTIKEVPTFSENSTLTIGKNFNGKIDELMVWGSDRTNNIQSDATEEYQWNIGSWTNIFLCSYYKGDDPENVGKDSQSLYAIADIMHGYYANHNGATIRAGIISSLPNSGWKQVLNDDDNLDRFIESAKEIVKHFDGLDVDLEWAVEGNYWSRYNHIVSRLINEVMVDYPEKIFSVSLHAYSYAGFDTSLFDGIDYFTMQIYDWDLSYSTYTNFYNSLSTMGFPDDKILLSYPVLVYSESNFRGLVGGYKDLFEKWGMTAETLDPAANQWTDPNTGTIYYYNGLDLLDQKMDFIVDTDLRGVMYFDMGNDLRVDDPNSMIRIQNEKISANIDTIVTDIDMTPSGVRNIASTRKAAMFTATNDGANITVTLADAGADAVLDVYSVDGRAVMQQLPLTQKVTTIAADGLQRGVYLLAVTQDGRRETAKVVIK